MLLLLYVSVTSGANHRVIALLLYHHRVHTIGLDVLYATDGRLTFCLAQSSLCCQWLGLQAPRNADPKEQSESRVDNEPEGDATNVTGLSGPGKHGFADTACTHHVPNGHVPVHRSRLPSHTHRVPRPFRDNVFPPWLCAPSRRHPCAGHWRPVLHGS